MRMMTEETNKFWSPSNKLARSGFLSRSANIAESNSLAKLLIEKANARGIKVSYDIAYNGFPQELVITEIFGGHGCVYIHPADRKFGDHMMEHAGTGDRDASFLKESADKYALFTTGKEVDRLVILPGTNQLSKVDMGMLRDVIKGDTMFKPHPITTRHFIEKLKLELGQHLILPRFSSGAELIRNCKELVVSVSTELGLYARLQGKKVDVLPDNTFAGSAYQLLYDNIEILPELVTTPKSGILFRGEDMEKEIDTYLDYYQEELIKWKNRSK